MSGPFGEEQRARSVAADLERYASTTEIEPDADLRSRVLLAIAREPAPAPLAAIAAAARTRRGRMLLSRLGDLWRVTTSGGRPIAIRWSAGVALAVIVAGVGSAGGYAAVNAWQAIQAISVPASPSPAASPRRVMMPSGPAGPVMSPSEEPHPAMAPGSMPPMTPAALPVMTPGPTRQAIQTMTPTRSPTPMGSMDVGAGSTKP